MIDEKGKLFGKINIVDLLVILIVIITAVVLGVKFLGGGKGQNGGGGHILTYTVVVPAVRQDVFDKIQAYIPGGEADKLMAAGELLDGKITAVTAAPHIQNATLATQNGTLIVPLDANTLDVTFTIEARVSNPITSELGTQEVRIGKRHIVKTQHIELENGIITDCKWSDEAAAKKK